MRVRTTVSAVLYAALVVALAAPAGALASPCSAAPAVSAFTLPVVVGQVAGAVPALASAADRNGEALVYVPAGGRRLEAARYRPRQRGEWGNRVFESPSEIHLGFFDPEGHGTDSFVLGFRGGPLVDPNIQLGLDVDWQHNSESQKTVGGEPYYVGGQKITPQRELSSSSSNLFPVMAYIQVVGNENMQVIPFVGLGGGYEVLFLSADAFQSQEHFDGTFGGWGWQVWGGAAVPLSGRARLAGEVFLNQAQVGRDVEDINGLTFREVVDMDGVGMRFGLQWGF